MQCPQCQIAMEERERSYAKVDLCPRCHTCWMDGGELEGLRDNLWHDREGRPSELPSAGEDLQRSCPRCPEESLHSGRLWGMWIEFCNSCNGSFWPGNELRTLKRKLARGRLVKIREERRAKERNARNRERWWWVIFSFLRVLQRR